MKEEPKLHSGLLVLDCPTAIETIVDVLKASLRRYKRKGFVLGVSGGIDSSVCAALCVKAVGKDRVKALLMPEKDSAQSHLDDAVLLSKSLGIDYKLIDISPTLEAIGCYHDRDIAVREVFPEYSSDWGCKLSLSENTSITSYDLTVESPNGKTSKQRCPADAFKRIIAASNHKQRIRKALEYQAAEENHYCVIGTPNLLEYKLGFFVKSGDGMADVKPIAHLYKSQVYQLAKALNLPDQIATKLPSTDTFSLNQSQEEFFFRLPYKEMDMVLLSIQQGYSAEQFAQFGNIGIDDADLLFKQVKQTLQSASYQLSPAIVIES